MDIYRDKCTKLINIFLAKIFSSAIILVMKQMFQKNMEVFSMRKLLSLLLCLMLLLAIVPVSFAESTYELAMVTDVGNIDDESFNQYTYTAVKQFGEETGKAFSYYKPSEDSTDARVEAISSAVDKGAKVVVAPGFLFEDAIKIAQEKFPEVNFLFIDYDMGDEATPNTHCIIYKEEQAGFLAGYAAVKDGYKNLGFLGGVAVPAVVRYGEGFVQGAEIAAKELGLTDVNIKYWYSNSFTPTDEIKTKMSGWITEGTEIVFACGGGILYSLIKAADEGNAKVIGVDVDQSSVNERIVTSAVKELTGSTVESLKALYANDLKWPEAMAGKTAVLGAQDDGVGLPTAEGSWRFKTFTVDEYHALFEKLKSGEIEVSDKLDEHPTVENVKVDYME